MDPAAEPSFSYFEWFFRALGYWYSFTLLIGFSVFVWSCCEFFLKTRIRFRGFHGVLVLLPILVSMLGAIDSGVTAYLIFRQPVSEFSSFQIAREVVLTAGGSLVFGVFVAFPSFVVLFIRWLLPAHARASGN